MNLYVTGPSFANGDYTDGSGHVIYRVHTSDKVLGMTTSITREISSGNDARDTSFQVVQIRYGGEEFTPRQFFTEGTHSSWGSKDRVFCAPDGQKYRWILGPHVPSLFRDDGTPIAKHHRPTLFGKHKTDKVRLEIFTEGKDMVDLIFVTFLSASRRFSD
ncbi:hypothetical protein C8J56DRAFT_950072 [Mycena floridula]|nr:hypothetical protein C8J56DRAFT_950072 [Mycena floridula]